MPLKPFILVKMFLSETGKPMSFSIVNGRIRTILNLDCDLREGTNDLAKIDAAVLDLHYIVVKNNNILKLRIGN